MSSGSESDEDYVPKEPEQVSEEESADEDTEKQYESEIEQKTAKRKLIEDKKPKKKLKLGDSVNDNELPEEANNKTEKLQDPEAEKKHEEDLWAKFLDGTETKSKPKNNDSNISKETPVSNTNQNTLDKSNISKTDDEKSRDSRIFEFAGETIVVENNVIKERVATKLVENSPTGSKSQSAPLKTRRSGGLAGFVSQLNKKNSLSTLDKSKLDWNTYKKDEGVEEEIQTFNKGKQGFLEKRDFLERADLRQYEIERDLRLTKRSNR